MAINLPGLNYNSKLSVDDLAFEADEQEKAILDRIKATFGHLVLATPKYGIRDLIDPTDIVATETDRPLLVFTSTNDPLKVNITAGAVITPNGAIVENTALVEDFELARTTVNDIVVVYVENEIEDTGPVRKTRFNTDQPTRRTQSTDFIRSALLTDFTNAVLFPPTRIENIVVLSVITVVQTTSGTELQFDYTQSTYSFNRPWFSPVDVEHRSFLGSGTPTANNPHGLTFNDLVSGFLTFYEQLLQTGLIQARDDVIKGVPGSKCTETITPGRILTDTTGGITAGSRFGGPGASYIELSTYPVQVTAFYQESHKGRAIAWDHVRGTKIIVLPGPETFSVNAVIEYTDVAALEPPAQLLSNTLTFGQPNTATELIYTGGLAVSELTNQFIGFDGSGPVPRNYTIFCKNDGTLLKVPEPLGTVILLDDIGTALTPVSASFFGPAQLSIGLADAVSISTMSISIRLYGRDVDGNAIQEDITFIGTEWVPVTVPGVETEGQYQLTTNVFTELTEIQVLSRTDDGPNSKVQFWAELETETTQDLNTLAQAADLLWDGLAINNLRDIRQIVKNIPPDQNRFRAAAEMTGLGGTSRALTFSDDFACPKLRDSTRGSQTTVEATVSITINNYVLIQAGDTILFPTGKTITAQIVGAPDRTLGFYLAGTSDQATRDDMVLTINDPTFASGFTAVADGTITNLLTCTAQALGALGNGPVSEPVEGNVGAILLSGDAVGGIDAYGETFTPRHQHFIDTDIPSPATYDVTGIRGRFLSVPMPVNSKLSVELTIHGVPPPMTNLQVRARVAIGSSEVWEPWEVLTLDGATATVTKASVITKIQIEIFGRASGFSLYEAP